MVQEKAGIHHVNTGCKVPPAGIEPATFSLAYHYSFHYRRLPFVVWTITSPFQVQHV